MVTVNMHEAKTRLSSLIANVEKKHEVIILCKKGRPVAEIIPLRKKRSKFSLKSHPVLSGIRINYDPTEPLSSE